MRFKVWRLWNKKLREVYGEGEHKGKQVDITVELPGPAPSKNSFAAEETEPYPPETQRLLRKLLRGKEK